MFSEKLKHMRKKLGITQAKLAEELKVSSSTIGMYEQGRREPDTAMLIKIAKFFDVSVDYLVDAKKSNKHIRNIDELAEQIEIMLREQSDIKLYGEPVNSDKIDSIVQAVKLGIHEAFKK